MNKQTIGLLIAGMLGLTLGACSPSGVQPDASNKNGEFVEKPAEAGKPIGEFPEVDIDKAEFTTPYSQEPGDLPTYAIDINNGHFTPRVLVVPQNVKFRLRITNSGDKPCEFESLQLRKEKPLYMKASSSLVILPLERGKYDMFDDFTNGHPGYIVAK